MGTYICTLAPPDIPEESLSEFIDRLLIIANQGGMMKLTHTALLSRDIILLSPICPDDDGCIDFFYNYFEEESWENESQINQEPAAEEAAEDMLLTDAMSEATEENLPESMEFEKDESEEMADNVEEDVLELIE